MPKNQNTVRIPISVFTSTWRGIHAAYSRIINTNQRMCLILFLKVCDTLNRKRSCPPETSRWGGSGIVEPELSRNSTSSISSRLQVMRSLERHDPLNPCPLLGGTVRSSDRSTTLSQSFRGFLRSWLCPLLKINGSVERFNPQSVSSAVRSSVARSAESPFGP